ncbi:MAG: hypothetical protein ABSA65_11590 [Acidimicrobiales bacterium]|jgi:hypothetical protein
MSTGLRSRRARPRRSRRFRNEVLGLAVISASVVSGCGATHAAGPAAKISSPAIRALLATSIETSAGSWAIVAMGHLDQPLNTFWQLFFRPTGGALWSDRAAALAVATNGGLVVASPGGRFLVVGIRPSVDLEYSPLIVTSDARSWTSSGPLDALADEPDALALASGGEALALVGDSRATRVLASPGGLAGWRQVASEHELATSDAGRACGIVSLTAVGYVGGQGLLGASCRRSGVVGVFAAHAGTWRLAGPSLPRSVGTSGTELLGLETTSRGLCALIASVGRLSGDVVAACTGTKALNWRVSPPLPLARREGAISFGPAGGLGLYALVSGSARRDTLAVLGESDMTWRALPRPPTGTATVVFDPAGRVDALSVADTSFTDWRLVGGATWRKVQGLYVAIQFGSSS